VTVAVRVPGQGPGGRDTRVRKFAAFYGVLREMARWLASQGVTHVAMEATGVYTMPVYHALLEPGVFERVLVCNAAHVKNVPGRKTDAVDASWLAELLECGLVAAASSLRRRSRRSAMWSATGARSSRNERRRLSGWAGCSRTPGSSWTRWPQVLTRFLGWR